MSPFSTEQNVFLQKHVPMRMLAIVFGITSFLSALLLFQVQLIVCKYILPWFGGSAAVWTTSMLVFQFLLMGGYMYSHFISERLSRRAQSTLHLALLCSALVLVVGLSLGWPSAITPGANWKPQVSTHPVRDVIAILLLSTGLPFFVLSTTGPLLQRWMAWHGGSDKTYRLYAVSNVGSLLGLLTFPFLLEPILHMVTQGRLWALLFGVFCLGCGWCAWRGRDENQENLTRADIARSSAKPVTASVRVLWFLLPACTSALLLATTNMLCQEITSIPLLWVLPLAFYLLSFILCFDHPRWYRRAIYHPLLALGMFALVLAIQFKLRLVQVAIMPLQLFLLCMVLHGELVRLKPDVSRLTSFYLAISAGGALGGIFVAIIAPLIFRFFTEYPVTLAASIILLLCCLFMDGNSWIYRMGFWLPAAIVAGTVTGAYVAGLWIPALPEVLTKVRFYPLALLVGAPVLTFAYMQDMGRRQGSGKKGFSFGQVLVVSVAILMLVLLYESAQPGSDLYLSKRNFYGALRVYGGAQQTKVLMHGQTVHGVQLRPPNDRLPVAYYGQQSGIGILLQNDAQRHIGNGNLRVGVVGLGVGTLATYGMPGDYFRYYEINPDVIKLSSEAQPVFTYLRDSAAKIDTELGDARLLLEAEAARGEKQNFDVLVLDAFSGDAIPVHLLTTQAFDTYWKHLNPDHGVIAIHVTSRHVNLLPVLEGTAEYYHASMLLHAVPGKYPLFGSLWVFLARKPEDLKVDGLTPTSSPVPNYAAPRVWTDDYSDIIRLLY